MGRGVPSGTEPASPARIDHRHCWKSYRAERMAQSRKHCSSRLAAFRDRQGKFLLLISVKKFN